MQIGQSTLYNIGSSYTIKLNDKQVLVVDEDPLSKDLAKAKKDSAEKKQEEQKVKENQEKGNPEKLSQDEKRLLDDLKARDAEVKTHEAAHQSSAGGLAGAASYTYQQGPDGKMYAIGGEVSISTGGASTPEEAIANAKKIESSAMAASSPSSQDFSVASSARMMEMKAKQQLSKQDQNKLLGQETYKNAMQLTQN
jgi:hypothetical protein